jgi:hypothetical protein
MSPRERARKFRFGVSNHGSAPMQWERFARHVEGLGYSTLVISDHFGTTQLAPLPSADGGRCSDIQPHLRASRGLVDAHLTAEIGSAESRNHVASDLVHLVAHPGHVAGVGRQDHVLDTDAAVIADGVDHVFRAAVEP